MTDNYKEQSGFIPTGSIQWDSSWPELASEAERCFLFSYMEDRFGIPGRCFKDYLLFGKKKSWWLIRKSPHIRSSSRFKVSMVGMKAFQRINDFVKPTTKLIRIFGHDATRAKLNIDEGHLRRFGEGETLPTTLEIENGYVILTFHGHILGLGLLIDGMVHAQIPKKEHRLLVSI